jgi:hypothetical protein
MQYFFMTEQFKSINFLLIVNYGFEFERIIAVADSACFYNRDTMCHLKTRFLVFIEKIHILVRYYASNVNGVCPF